MFFSKQDSFITFTLQRTQSWRKIIFLFETSRIWNVLLRFLFKNEDTRIVAFLKKYLDILIYGINASLQVIG